MSNEVKVDNTRFLEILTLLFITLKLTNVIAWSWWLVLAPLWLPAVVLLAALAITSLVISLKK